MRRIWPIILAAALFAGCASVPESNQAAVETAWELADILIDSPGLTLAVGKFELTDIPDALDSTFRNDLSTSLATAFRELELDHRVVTRDQVDEVFAEQSMDLEGLTYREAQIRIGQVVGADVLVVGTLIWLEDDLYRSSAQLIETGTGFILGGTSWDFWFDTESNP
jgi:curli biogenesis system outer membrane secretion channel CsgG